MTTTPDHTDNPALEMQRKPCDYRDPHCSDTGRMVGGRWACDNHLSAVATHRCPHFEPKGEDSGGAYSFAIIQDVANDLLDTTAKERLAAKPTAWYSLLIKQLIQRIANLRVMLAHSRAPVAAINNEWANDAANKIADYFNAPPSVIPAVEKIIQRCAPAPPLPAQRARDADVDYRAPHVFDPIGEDVDECECGLTMDAEIHVVTSPTDNERKDIALGCCGECRDRVVGTAHANCLCICHRRDDNGEAK